MGDAAKILRPMDVSGPNWQFIASCGRAGGDDRSFDSAMGT
jgi:hypothetical protein